MTVILAVVLIVLGLAIGFIITWAFEVGGSPGLFMGVLLVVAGAVVGFIVEWIIDEAHRRNRELRQQLNRPGGGEVAPVGAEISTQSSDTASQALVEFLRQRDDEVSKLREQIAATDVRMDTLRDEFESYQQTHPDDLTVIRGIGEVYQRKLRDIGFNSFDQLAKVDPGRLRRMLDIKDWQRSDVESWIEQARDWSKEAGNA